MATIMMGERLVTLDTSTVTVDNTTGRIDVGSLNSELPTAVYAPRPTEQLPHPFAQPTARGARAGHAPKPAA